MEGWHDFFVAEVGAAAAFAGLIFVSLSVNQARILQYGGLAERGLQSLTALLLVFVVASVALAPDQTPLRLGVETLVFALVQIATQTRLQVLGYRATDALYRRSFRRMAVLAQCASWFFVLGAVLILARGDYWGIDAFVAGTILSFVSAGAIAWVLLIEVNR